MPLDLRCRYNADEHGTFTNPVTLMQHYQNEHADVYVHPSARANKIYCPDCHRDFAPDYYNKHRRQQHGPGVTPRRPGMRAPRSTAPKWRCNICRRDYVTNDSVRGHFRTQHPGMAWSTNVTRVDGGPMHLSTEASSTWLSTTGAAPVADEAHTDEGELHHPWVADDIVLPAVTQLAEPSGVIPVAHLAAILVWRDATAVMLAAVTNGRR